MSLLSRRSVKAFCAPCAGVAATLLLLGACDASDASEGSTTAEIVGSSDEAEGLGPLAGAMAVVERHVTYRGSWSGSASCSVDYDMTVFEPVAPGRYPVFVYTMGTGAIVDGAEGRLVAEEMAKRGFVAATAHYANDLAASCTNLENKARCLYSPWKPQSAVSKLCSRAKSDCGKGIVVGGMSQGAAVAALANDFEPRVRAAWAMGFGDFYGLSTCVRDGVRRLPGDRLRIVNGADQDVASTARAAGVSCPASEQACFRPNGSGYYFVRDVQVQDGHADHCYYVGPGPGGSEVGCSNNPTFDVGWAPGAMHPWSLVPNLAWLDGFTG